MIFSKGHKYYKDLQNVRFFTSIKNVSVCVNLQNRYKFDDT